MCKGIVLSSNSVEKFVVILYICSHFAEEKSQKTDRLTLKAFLLSCDCLCTVLFIIVIVDFRCNTYLFSYTDRKTDRLTDGKTDRQEERQVNNLKHFFLFL